MAEVSYGASAGYSENAKATQKEELTNKLMQAIDSAKDELVTLADKIQFFLVPAEPTMPSDSSKPDSYGSSYDEYMRKAIREVQELSIAIMHLRERVSWS